MKTLTEIISSLSTPASEIDYDSILVDLNKHKVNSLKVSDETEAKHIWCLEHSVLCQQLFRQAFSTITAGQFYEGWCLLEKIELALNRLKRHFNEKWSSFRLDFIEEKTASIQSLYPYKIFLSPELIEHEKKCTICGRVISLREPCGHRVGEIYNGQYCARIVTNAEIVGSSFVESPVQKYSVPFTLDPQTGKKIDNYNYAPLKYLVERWPAPFNHWELKWTTASYPKTQFEPIGRNTRCLCGSGKKYKKCCLDKNTITMPHVQFYFYYPLPEELRRQAFSF